MYILGIAGGTASGKSTISKMLERCFADNRIKAFHMDEYYKKPVPKITGMVTGVEYGDYNHPDSLELTRLCEDIETAKTDATELIIIEGLFALAYEPIRRQLDLKVFVDCKADERIVRRIKRNLAWNQSIEEITSVYLDAVRYRHDQFVEPSKWQADVIVNGSQNPKLGIDLLTSWIRSKL